MKDSPALPTRPRKGLRLQGLGIRGFWLGTAPHPVAVYNPGSLRPTSDHTVSILHVLQSGGNMQSLAVLGVGVIPFRGWAGGL